MAAASEAAPPRLMTAEALLPGFTCAVAELFT